ncbi:MAG: sortase B protein-sorting domain-containing protein, partial [Lachnospiraceae bacterium]|nr:sortase B protein-sorting domain-containing protein [Lachnospiraceae bacterium]
WTDGSAATTFTVKEAVTEEATSTTDTQKDEVPKTGDHSPIVWLFVLVMVSGGTLLCLGRKKKTLR